jgi:uncharacterized protein (TIGR03086 family)
MVDRSDTVFLHGLDAFGDVAEELTPADWDRPSPCEGWTALDVLGHLGAAIGFGVSLLRGEDATFPEAPRPADLVTGEPTAYWGAIADSARDALDGADLEREMDTPMGKRTLADRLAFPAIDLYVHAWDIGKTAGIPVEIPGDVIEFAHTHLDPIPAEMFRGEGKPFGPEADAPDDATPTQEFVAWTGRAPH